MIIIVIYLGNIYTVQDNTTKYTANALNYTITDFTRNIQFELHDTD